MPLRFGEMVLIIRTQDFASRNLERVSANLGKLSKFQQLSRRQAQLGLREARVSDRISNVRKELANLRVLERQFDIQSRMAKVSKDRILAEERLARLQRSTAATGMIRGPGGRFAGPAAPAIAQLQTLTHNLTLAERALDRELGLVQKQIASMPAGMRRLGSSQADVTARSTQLQGRLKLLRRELKGVQADIAVTNTAISKVRWDTIHRAGQTVSRLGRTMQLTGLIATGSFVAAGNAAANFGQQVTLAATQTRDLNAPIAQVAERSTKLQDAILAQMQKFPGSAEGMANAAYEIFSSLDLADKGRIKFWRGLQILQKANKVAVAGGIELDEAIKGLIITLNNFDPELDDVNSTLDTMFDIVRFGNIRVSDFTQMMTKVAPAAKGVGHTLEGIGGSIAFLTRVMAPQRVATGFARLEDAFSNRDFIDGVKIVSKARLGEALDIEKPGGGLKPFLGILQDLVALFPELKTGQLSAQEFFKIVTSAGREGRIGRPSEGLQFTAEGRRAFTNLVQNMEQVEELQRLIEGNQGEFNNAFAAMAKTPAIQWKIFLNQLKAVALEIGREALPSLLYLAGGVQRLIEWFRNLDPRTKNLIVKIGVFASVLTLVGGVALSVVGGLIALASAVALLSTNVGTGRAGLVGRLAMMLSMLRALTLIGVITITSAMVFKKTGLSQWIDEQAGRVEKALDKAGVKGGAKVIGAFRELDRMTGLVEDKGGERKGLVFNPKAKLYTPKQRKEFQQLAKDLRTVRNESDFDRIIKTAKSDTLRQLRDEFGMNLEEIRNQFSSTGEEAGQMAQAIDQAAQQAEQSIDQAASNLTQIWNQFRDENKQAFGELFTGPFFQSETWKLAEEWDVKPTMREINRDLREQIGKFREWRNTLNAISRRKGVSAELMDELRQLGPDALDKLEVLRKAAPKQFNDFIRLWQIKQKEIEKATKIDFDKQLKQWFSFGKGIAQNIILGLQSEDAALDAAFKKYITSKFPGIVAQARQEAKKEFVRQANATKNERQGVGSSRTTNNTTTTNTTNVHVHPAKGEKTKDVVRRATWEQKDAHSR